MKTISESAGTRGDTANSMNIFLGFQWKMNEDLSRHTNQAFNLSNIGIKPISLLLDIHSTLNLFHNPSFLTDLRDGLGTMVINFDASTARTSTVGNLLYF